MKAVRGLGRSFGELFATGLSKAWALITGLAAGIVLFWEHVLPKEKVADRLWPWIVLGGIVIGVFLAFHRVRQERDEARAAIDDRAAIVDDSHRVELTAAAARLRQNVYSELLAQLDNEARPGVLASAPVFAAHFPERSQELAEWNKAYFTEEKPEALRDHLVEELGFDMTATTIRVADECPVCQRNVGA